MYSSRRKQITLITVSAAIVFALTGCGSPGTGGGSDESPTAGSLDDVIAAAKKEGALELVGPGSTLGGNDVVTQLGELMNKTYGTDIDVRVSPGPSQQQVLEQVATEYQAGQPASTDLVGGTPFQFVTVDELGILSSPGWEDLDPDVIDSDMVDNGYALRVGTGLATIVYNTDLVQDPPQTLKELLDPRWTGKIATTSYAAGFDVLADKSMYGPEATADFANEFSPQVNALVRCANGGIDQVVSKASEIFALECVGNYVRLYQRDGAPVNQVIPLDAAQKRYQMLAIPKNAEHPNAAALFALTAVSPEGQKILWETGGFDLDILPNSHVGEEVKAAEDAGATFFVPTIEYLLDHPDLDDAKTAFIEVLQKQGAPVVGG